MMKIKKGFTFIEILVVVSIIAILTSIGVVSYSNTQKGARDAKRKADLESIRSALEMYRSDNDVYPGNFSTLVSGGYIQAIPAPPVNSLPTTYQGGYTTNDTTYSISTRLEKDGSTYYVYNP